jgi:hypothetical protein
MQPFDFLCSHCHGTLRVSIPELVGRKVHCPHCRKPIVVQEPEVTGFAWGEQTAEGQIGSGLRLSAGSGLALAGSSEDGDDLDQHHVWADDYPQEDDSVLSGESAASWQDQEPALDSESDSGDSAGSSEDEVTDLLESDAVGVGEAVIEEAAEAEAAEVEAVDAEAEPEAVVAEEAPAAEEEPADDDAPSVEIESPTSRSERRYSTPARRGTEMPHPMLLVGAAFGVILMLVAVGMAMSSGSRSGSGARSKYSNGKVQRRNPQEFQDFAREAARRGW